MAIPLSINPSPQNPKLFLHFSVTFQLYRIFLNYVLLIFCWDQRHKSSFESQRKGFPVGIEFWGVLGHVVCAQCWLCCLSVGLSSVLIVLLSLCELFMFISVYVVCCWKFPICKLEVRLLNLFGLLLTNCSMQRQLSRLVLNIPTILSKFVPWNSQRGGTYLYLPAYQFVRAGSCLPLDQNYNTNLKLFCPRFCFKTGNWALSLKSVNHFFFQSPPPQAGKLKFRTVSGARITCTFFAGDNFIWP